MRKTIAALLGCLALTGCSSDWQGETAFKVAEFYDHQLPDGATEKRVKLDPVGSPPQDAEPDHLKGLSVLEHEIVGAVGVEDGVVCLARHESGETKISGCKKS
ncbi:hypothetical protein [Lentzea sp. NPDC003310]|uniref:hypothetical protein n=1 Tax=Lentzea sp. NPDC003310 TaxID=3154447 RepID=UPI0033A5394B